jgi:hypothetical protein
MAAQHAHPARTFHPDPLEYDYAQKLLAVRGRTVGEFLHASVRWLNSAPDTALASLAPAWPPTRFTGRPTLAVAYALLDRDEPERGWLGDPDLDLAHRDYPAPRPFEPADPDNPRFGHRFVFRCGNLGGSELLTLYAVRVVIDDGREIAVRMTHPVMDVLFGPPILGTPERRAWEELRRRASDSEDTR